MFIDGMWFTGVTDMRSFHAHYHMVDTVQLQNGLTIVGWKTLHGKLFPQFMF